MTTQELKKIKSLAKKLMLQNKNSLHDWDHVCRVADNTLKIVASLKIKKIDCNLLLASAYLHDLCYSQNIQTNIKNYIRETKLSCRLISQLFKKELNFISEKEQQIILDAVKHHAWSFPFRKLNKKRSLYCKILQDADTIDYFHPTRLTNFLESKQSLKLFFLSQTIYFFGLNKMHLFLNQKKLACVFGRNAHRPLVYKEFGKENQKTLIVISGYKSFSSNFQFLIDNLAKKYHLFFIELPTVCNFMPNLNIKELVNYIDRIISKHHLDKFEIAGFSFGGLVATAYAVENSQKVEKLVLLSSSPKLITSKIQLSIFKIIKPILTSKAFAKTYVLLNSNNMVRKLWGNAKIEPPMIKFMKKNAVPIFTTLFENLGLDYLEAFNQLAIPKIIFLCEDDEVVKFNKFYKLAKKTTAELFIAEKGGHNLTQDYQVNVAKIWQTQNLFRSSG